MYRFFIKQIIDVLVSLVTMILLLPIFLMVLIGLFFANSGKPFSFKIAQVKTVKYSKSLNLKP